MRKYYGLVVDNMCYVENELKFDFNSTYHTICKRALKGRLKFHNIQIVELKWQLNSVEEQ